MRKLLVGLVGTLMLSSALAIEGDIKTGKAPFMLKLISPGKKLLYKITVTNTGYDDYTYDVTVAIVDGVCADEITGCNLEKAECGVNWICGYNEGSEVTECNLGPKWSLTKDVFIPVDSSKQLYLLIDPPEQRPEGQYKYYLNAAIREQGQTGCPNWLDIVPETIKYPLPDGGINLEFVRYIGVGLMLGGALLIFSSAFGLI